MYVGYLYYNSTEIANNQRVVAYLNGNPALGIPGLKGPNLSVSANCGCDAIDLYCDQGSGPNGTFLSPKLDNAPWYDPDVPDSSDFAGFFIEDITGFDSVVKREFSEGAISGGSLGPLRLSGRCMTVTGWLMASTCCGAEYGLRWLNEALMGNVCDDCAYGDLYMIKCCPPEGDSCHINQVSATDTIPNTNVSFSVTAGAPGIYTFVIDDALQTNLVSDPTGAPNNVNGAIPSCYGSGNSFRFVLADEFGAIFTFFIPYEIITSFATSSSGVGASLTFTVDTNIQGSCDDVVRYIERFASQVDEYLSTYDSAEVINTNSPTQVRCFETVSGYNPDDYIRLLHRVGLTEGPTVLERFGTCCSNDCGCTYLKVEFTLCSEFPYIFSDINWCVEKETFDFDECYCLNFRKLCNTCSTQDTTKFVEREVRRPNCPIELRHDGTWCQETWPDGVGGCPPEDCILTVGTIEEFKPEDTSETTAGTATQKNQLFININADFTWTPVNFDVNDGFPPDFADLYLFNGGNCWEEIKNPYKVESGSADCKYFVLLGPPGSYTWSPFLWDPVSQGFPPSPCAISVVPGICECPTTSPRPEPAEGEPDPVIDCGNGIWYNPDDCTRGCDPCGACNTCKPDCSTDGALVKCPIRLIWNKANNTYRFEPLTFISGTGGATGYGDCDCFEVTEYVVEGVHPCQVRIIYDEGTGAQTWEPIHWSGTLPFPDDCDCISIAEIVVNKTKTEDCDDETDCPINVMCGTDYRPDICTSREAICTFFYRYNGSPSFTPPATPSFSDVPLSHPSYLEIEWAYAQGLIEGFGDGTFRPDDGVYRQVVAAMFYRDAGSPSFVPPTTQTFTDVGITHSFYLEIEWAYDQAILFGFDDGSFRAQDCLTRRSAATAFYRYNDTQPTWSDVPCDHSFYLEIEWAKSQNIFRDYGDGMFHPNNAVTRRVAALAFYRYAGEPAFVPPGTPTFLDVPLTDPQYLEIEWAYAQGIFNGFPGPNFQPDSNLSRQDCAVAFYRYNGSPPFTPPGVPTFLDVPLTHPFYLEIEWCYANGIMEGFPGPNFQPTSDTTRQDISVSFYRDAGSPTYTPACYTPSLPPFFGDVSETDPQFQQIEWMHDQGIAFGFINSRSWEPIGWEIDPDEVFPPANCNIYIETVNGAPQDTSPIKELIEVPFDEFVPDCGPFPSPLPPIAVIETPCYCEPWEQARKCCTFDNPADWNDVTSYIEVWTGSEEMRNLKIEAYRNPFGEKVPCPCDPEDEFWDCRDPCSTIIVPQLPARSRLIIDSRQRVAQLVLVSGRVVNALRYIFSGDGKPFEWFDIGQCATFCIIVQADCRQTAKDAEISVGAIGRYTASGW